MVLLLSYLSSSLAQESNVLVHQGIERKYLVYFPKSGGPGPRPAVIYLHGVRPSGWKNWRWPVLEQLAEREGVLVFNPEAIDFRWNYAHPDAMPSAPAKVGELIIDDVGFLVALMDDQIAKGIVDPARIYVTGDSRGGIMTFELMCKASAKIAAAGPLIASMTEMQRAACAPERPVPFMAVNGTLDDNIFYDGWIRNGKRQISTPTATLSG